MNAELELAEEIASCYADPLRFVLMAYPWGEAGGPLADLDGPYPWQVKWLNDLGEEVRKRGFNGRDPVKAIRMSASTGHGVGKSTLCAWLINWIMATRPHSKGTVTANTVTQLETKTWASIQVWTKRCITSHWWEVTQTRISHKNFRSSWFCSAQTCREENSEAFAGQHAADSTSYYFFDEGSAVPDKIYEVAEGGLVKGEPMIFVFGNPTRNSGKFFRINFGSEMARWNHRSIDSRDASPSISEEVQGWLEEWGEDSDFFRVRVRGLPPRASDLQFISSALVQDARKRDHRPLADEPLVAGFDAANGGMAYHVIAFRRGLDGKNVPACIRLKGDTPRDVVIAKLAEVMSRRGDQRVAALFGDQAFGAVMLERLRNMGFTNCFEVNFGAPESPDTRHCANMRAFMWRSMREWLHLGSIPDEEALELDLCGPGAEQRPNGKLVLESKADMAKRGVKSPDWGDALALTFARRVAPPPPPSAYDIPIPLGGAWA